jgi:hypothetical protein
MSGGRESGLTQRRASLNARWLVGTGVVGPCMITWVDRASCRRRGHHRAKQGAERSDGSWRRGTAHSTSSAIRSAALSAASLASSSVPT